MMRDIVMYGKTNEEVAKKYKVTGNTVRVYRRLDEWVQKEALMKEDVYGAQKMKLAALAEPAIEALGQTLKSEDESIKLRSATEILDRTGFPKGVQIDIEMKPVINLFMPEFMVVEDE